MPPLYASLLSSTTTIVSYALLPNWKPCYVMARHLTIACAATLTLYQARTSTPEMDNPVHTIKAGKAHPEVKVLSTQAICEIASYHNSAW